MTTISITAFGADPENPDNTAHIQSALNAAGPGDTVLVPPSGEFLVNALIGIFPHSATNLQIDGGLRAIPNDQSESVLLYLRGVSNVNVFGHGYIAGERYQHLVPPSKDPAREGMCLAIRNSETISVGNGLTLKEGQADGIYVQDSANVTVKQATCFDNSRNGMSIISVNTMSVTNSTFWQTHSEGPMPQAGIDIEPDVATQAMLNLTITQNAFTKNVGAGVYIALNKGGDYRNIHVINNVFDQHYKDGCGPPIRGANDTLGWTIYTCCRWIPGYDWWCFPTQYEV